MLTSSSSHLPNKQQTRAIILLAIAGFASQSMVRSADTLLPQIAVDFGVSVGAASIIVSAYSIMHGSMQLIMGPIADRFGKYLLAAIMCACSAFTVAACGFAENLTILTLVRIASGATAAWIIPLGIAFIGDIVPYEKRQPVIGQYLAGQITGQMFGQAAGGIIGGALGWQAAFFIHASIFAIAAIALFSELASNEITRLHRSAANESFFVNYKKVFVNPWARYIIFAGFLEFAVMFGSFAYVGADLHLRFELNFIAVGLIIGTFAIGGLIYAGTVKQLVGRLGQTGLSSSGGAFLGIAYLILALTPVWWLTPIAVTLTGLGFYMLHNTLQTNATQMTPEARGTAVAVFASALYLGQTVGVMLVAPVIDRAGAVPVFLAAAILLPSLGFWVSRRIKARSAQLVSE